MSLKVIVGPMFAGKTSEIQSVVRRYQCLGKPVLVLTADIDTRFLDPGSAMAVVSKHLTVVGLDSDAEQQPFGEVLSLGSLADSIEKKTALCKRCGDGTAAIFTRALGSRTSGQVEVGGAELYEPVCRRHYHAQ